MHRVACDFNKSDRDSVWLSTPKSIEDIAQIENLAEGMRVIVYEPEEFEMQATLVRRPAMWVGLLHPETVIHCAKDADDEALGYIQAIWERAGLDPAPPGQPRFEVGQKRTIADAAFLT